MRERESEEKREGRRKGKRERVSDKQTDRVREIVIEKECIREREWVFILPSNELRIRFVPRFLC